MTPEIRKIAAHTEQTFIEGGKAGDRPVTMAVVAAVLRNPWAGRGFVEDLQPEIYRMAPLLGVEMTGRLTGVMPAAQVQAYGKAAAVGVNGEIEHGSALIHTLRFGNIFREAAGGTAYLSFTNTRLGAGAMLSLPMVHKTEVGKRSHFITATFQVADAPGPDEILIAIGDRFKDMEEMAATAAAR